MKIDRIDTLPFSLPLKTAWNSARGSLQQRRGWIIRIRADNGLQGFGECSPLPEAGSETHELARMNLPDAGSALIGCEAADGLVQLQERKQTPAVRCGIETALLDLLAREQQLPLHRLLNPASDDRVAVNGFLGTLERMEAQRFAAMSREGYRVVKLKVGLGAVDDELKHLTRILPAIPAGMMLRLDANGAWNSEQAARFIEGLSGLPVESLEEPLQHFDPDQWDRLQQQCPFPLALDESIGSVDENDILHCGVKRLIIKPMVLGGLSTSLSLAMRASEHGIQTVATSTVDGAIGVHAAAHLAAAMEIYGHPMAHGLDTSNWLQRDIAPPPQIESAKIRLSPQPGLGVVPDFSDP
jgi:o-succinylbenzoate synthase